MQDEMTSSGSDNPYSSEYPSNCNTDPEIKALIAHYYSQVDTKGKHAEYSECWAEDGVLIVPTGKEFRGREGMIQRRYHKRLLTLKSHQECASRHVEWCPEASSSTPEDLSIW